MVLFTMIFVLGLWLPSRSDGASIAFAAIFGIGSGACIGLAPVLIMTISPMEEVGFRMGTLFAVAGIGALTSPPIAGAIVQRTPGGDYVFACVFSGISFLVSTVFMVALRARIGGWKLLTIV